MKKAKVIQIKRSKEGRGNFLVESTVSAFIEDSFMIESIKIDGSTQRKIEKLFFFDPPCTVWKETGRSGAESDVFLIDCMKQKMENL